MVSALSGANTFALDIETTGLFARDSRILLCQIGVWDSGDNHVAFVIDATRLALDSILPFLESRKVRKIIQNSKFERQFFLDKYGIEIHNVYDTQLAEKVLHPDSFKYGLADLAEKYAGIKLDKSVRRTFFERKKFQLTQEQIEYAAMDVEVMWPIMEAQSKKLVELNLAHVAELEFALAQVVADMEEEGVPVDKPKWVGLLRDYERDHEVAREKLLDAIYATNLIDEQLGLFARGGINASSHDQIKKAFNKIGINVESTSEREISLIDHPAARALLEYRELDKIVTSYGNASFIDKIHPFTGRIHADFQQIGTETGRFACKEPNLQQMPKKFRECVGLEDWAIVGADYSQIELRILAEYSGEPVMLNAFETGQDIHKITASTMFGVPVDKVNDEQRFAAKTINFGIVYGMQAKKLMDMLNAEAAKKSTPKKSFMEAKKMLEAYHRTYPRASKWLTQTANQAYVSLMSQTMYGRKRFYTAPDGVKLTEKEYEQQVAAIKRKGSNTPIQGTNADITKLAMLNVYNNLKDGGYRAKIIIQVHDEIVVLAHQRQKEEVKSVILDSMLESAQQVLKRVPVKADAYISDYWKKG